MRKYIFLLVCVLLVACNDEWTKEQYINEVSFVKNGVVRVNVKYDSEGGIVPFKIPIIMSGTSKNSDDVIVSVALDPDTLIDLNFDRFRYREDLYFLELDPSYYEFESMSTVIPKGKDIGSLDVNFKLDGIDLVDKYILPLTITETSKYGVSTRKHFKKTLMHIVPFNDYSGRYSVAGEVWQRDVPENDQKPLTTPSREARVVDEHSIFFYAGVSEEESQDRSNYKVVASFNSENNTVSLMAENPAINFSQQEGSFTVEKKMDEVLPYLQRTYITMYLKYEYDDIENPDYPIPYRFTGSMVLEKVKNILIPEEDQQVVVD